MSFITQFTEDLFWPSSAQRRARRKTQKEGQGIETQHVQYGPPQT